MTYLELCFAHGAIETVFERLIFKVKLNIVVVFCVTDSDVKVDLHGTFGDRASFLWLTELDVVLEDVAILLSLKDLANVDLRPRVNNPLHNLFAFFCSHF